jgi:hypothetical protein
MSNYYILDNENQPIAVDDLAVWGKWMDAPLRRKLAVSKIGGAYISTCFLGLNYGTEESPLLWETMIFAEGWKELHYRVWKYASREEAIAGHENACRKVQEYLN